MIPLQQITRWVLSAFGLALIALAWMVAIDAARTLPDRVRLAEIRITPDRGAPVLLGRAELLQPELGPTAERHMAVFRANDGRILAHDITGMRRIGYHVDGEYRDTSRIVLPEGEATLFIEESQWDINRDGAELTLENRAIGTRAVVSPRGLSLSRYGRELDAAVPVFDRIQGWLLSDLQLRFSIGGTASPAMLADAVEARILPDEAVPPGAAALIYESEGRQWSLASGRVPARVQRPDGTNTTPEAHPLTLVGTNGEVAVDDLIIGFTYYSVTVPEDAPNAIVLRPVLRRAWIAPNSIEPLTDDRLERAIDPAANPVNPDGLWLALYLVLGIGILAWGLLAGAASRAWRPVTLATFGAGLAQPFGGFGIWQVVAVAVACAACVLMWPSSRMGLRGIWVMGKSKLGVWLSWRVFRSAAAPPPSASFLQTVCGHAPLVWRALILGALASGIFVLGPQFPAPDLQRSDLALAGAFLALASAFAARFMPVTAALFWVLLTVVAAFGIAAGLRLTHLQGTEAYLGLFEMHLFAMGSLGVTASAILTAHGVRKRASTLQLALLPGRRSRWVKWPLLLIGLLFIVITLVGDETGVGGLFQPSEVSKSLLVILIAMTLVQDYARRAMTSALEGGHSIWPLLTAAGFAGAILFTSARNYDMSPILVSLVAMAASLIAGVTIHWVAMGQFRSDRRLNGLPIPTQRVDAFTVANEVTWHRLKRFWALNSSMGPMILLGIFISVLFLAGLAIRFEPSFRGNGPLPLYDYLMTPWERIQSWLDLSLVPQDPLVDFPNTGTQLRRGREALLLAPCGAFLQAICPNLGELWPQDLAVAQMLRVPAIQDDFAAISMVYAVGIDGAILYITAQATLIGVALSLGVGALLQRNERRIMGWTLGCSILGLTALYLAQVGLAWGNVLGAFPIMGQPMTFVSFGGSHHLAVALPFVATILLASCQFSEVPIDTHDVRRALHRKKLV